MWKLERRGRHFYVTASNKEGNFQTRAKNINCKASLQNLSATLFCPQTFSGFLCRKPTHCWGTPSRDEGIPAPCRDKRQQLAPYRNRCVTLGVSLQDTKKPWLHPRCPVALPAPSQTWHPPSSLQAEHHQNPAWTEQGFRQCMQPRGWGCFGAFYAATGGPSNWSVLWLRLSV